jgi:flagellar biosynthesis chaperone FliJ
MNFWEKLGYKKKETRKQETPEQITEKEITEKIRQVLALERRIKEVKENVEAFGSAPADATLLHNLQEQIDTLNQEIKALGGQPVGPMAEEFEAKRKHGM